MSDSGSEYEYEEEIVEEIVTTKGGARHKALPAQGKHSKKSSRSHSSSLLQQVGSGGQSGGFGQVTMDNMTMLGGQEEVEYEYEDGSGDEIIEEVVEEVVMSGGGRRSSKSSRRSSKSHSSMGFGQVTMDNMTMLGGQEEVEYEYEDGSGDEIIEEVVEDVVMGGGGRRSSKSSRRSSKSHSSMGFGQVTMDNMTMLGGQEEVEYEYEDGSGDEIIEEVVEDVVMGGGGRRSSKSSRRSSKSHSSMGFGQMTMDNMTMLGGQEEVEYEYEDGSGDEIIEEVVEEVVMGGGGRRSSKNSRRSSKSHSSMGFGQMTMDNMTMLGGQEEVEYEYEDGSGGRRSSRSGSHRHRSGQGGDEFGPEEEIIEEIIEEVIEGEGGGRRKSKKSKKSKKSAEGFDSGTEEEIVEEIVEESVEGGGSRRSSRSHRSSSKSGGAMMMGGQVNMANIAMLGFANEGGRQRSGGVSGSESEEEIVEEIIEEYIEGGGRRSSKGGSRRHRSSKGGASGPEDEIVEEIIEEFVEGEGGRKSRKKNKKSKRPSGDSDSETEEEEIIEEIVEEFVEDGDGRRSSKSHRNAMMIGGQASLANIAILGLGAADGSEEEIIEEVVEESEIVEGGGSRRRKHKSRKGGDSGSEEEIVEEIFEEFVKGEGGRKSRKKKKSKRTSGDSDADEEIIEEVIEEIAEGGDDQRSSHRSNSKGGAIANIAMLGFSSGGKHRSDGGSGSEEEIVEEIIEEVMEGGGGRKAKKKKKKKSKGKEGDLGTDEEIVEEIVEEIEMGGGRNRKSKKKKKKKSGSDSSSSGSSSDSSSDSSSSSSSSSSSLNSDDSESKKKKKKKKKKSKKRSSSDEEIVEEIIEEILEDGSVSKKSGGLANIAMLGFASGGKHRSGSGSEEEIIEEIIEGGRVRKAKKKKKKSKGNGGDSGTEEETVEEIVEEIIEGGGRKKNSKTDDRSESEEITEEIIEEIMEEVVEQTASKPAKLVGTLLNLTKTKDEPEEEIIEEIIEEFIEEGKPRTDRRRRSNTGGESDEIEEEIIEEKIIEEIIEEAVKDTSSEPAKLVGTLLNLTKAKEKLKPDVRQREPSSSSADSSDSSASETESSRPRAKKQPRIIENIIETITYVDEEEQIDIDNTQKITHIKEAPPKKKFVLKPINHGTGSKFGKVVKAATPKPPTPEVSESGTYTKRKSVRKSIVEVDFEFEKPKPVRRSPSPAQRTYRRTSLPPWNDAWTSKGKVSYGAFYGGGGGAPEPKCEACRPGNTHLLLEHTCHRRKITDAHVSFGGGCEACQPDKIHLRLEHTCSKKHAHESDADSNESFVIIDKSPEDRKVTISNVVTKKSFAEECEGCHSDHELSEAETYVVSPDHREHITFTHIVNENAVFSPLADEEHLSCDNCNVCMVHCNNSNRSQTVHSHVLGDDYCTRHSEDHVTTYNSEYLSEGECDGRKPDFDDNKRNREKDHIGFGQGEIDYSFEYGNFDHSGHNHANYKNRNEVDHIGFLKGEAPEYKDEYGNFDHSGHNHANYKNRNEVDHIGFPKGEAPEYKDEYGNFDHSHHNHADYVNRNEIDHIGFHKGEKPEYKDEYGQFDHTNHNHADYVNRNEIDHIGFPKGEAPEYKDEYGNFDHSHHNHADYVNRNEIDHIGFHKGEKPEYKDEYGQFDHTNHNHADYVNRNEIDHIGFPEGKTDYSFRYGEFDHSGHNHASYKNRNEVDHIGFHKGEKPEYKNEYGQFDHTKHNHADYVNRNEIDHIGFHKGETAHGTSYKEDYVKKEIKNQNICKCKNCPSCHVPKKKKPCPKCVVESGGETTIKELRSVSPVKSTIKLDLDLVKGEGHDASCSTESCYAYGKGRRFSHSRAGTPEKLVIEDVVTTLESNISDAKKNRDRVNSSSMGWMSPDAPSNACSTDSCYAFGKGRRFSGSRAGTPEKLVIEEVVTTLESNISDAKKNRDRVNSSSMGWMSPDAPSNACSTDSCYGFGKGKRFSGSRAGTPEPKEEVDEAERNRSRNKSSSWTNVEHSPPPHQHKPEGNGASCSTESCYAYGKGRRFSTSRAGTPEQFVLEDVVTTLESNISDAKKNRDRVNSSSIGWMSPDAPSNACSTDSCYAFGKGRRFSGSRAGTPEMVIEEAVFTTQEPIALSLDVSKNEAKKNRDRVNSSSIGWMSPAVSTSSKCSTDSCYGFGKGRRFSTSRAVSVDAHDGRGDEAKKNRDRHTSSSMGWTMADEGPRVVHAERVLQEPLKYSTNHDNQAARKNRDRVNASSGWMEQGRWSAEPALRNERADTRSRHQSAGPSSYRRSSYSSHNTSQITF